MFDYLNWKKIPLNTFVHADSTFVFKTKHQPSNPIFKKIFTDSKLELWIGNIINNLPFSYIIKMKKVDNYCNMGSNFISIHYQKDYKNKGINLLFSNKDCKMYSFGSMKKDYLLTF